MNRLDKLAALHVSKSLFDLLEALVCVYLLLKKNPSNYARLRNAEPKIRSATTAMLEFASTFEDSELTQVNLIEEARKLLNSLFWNGSSFIGFFDNLQLLLSRHCILPCCDQTNQKCSQKTPQDPSQALEQYTCGETQTFGKESSTKPNHSKILHFSDLQKKHREEPFSKRSDENQINSLDQNSKGLEYESVDKI